MIKKTLVSIAMAAAASVAFGQTSVSSDITTNTTWSGTVHLENPVFVKGGATLTILPGTIVRGQPRQVAATNPTIVGTPGALIVAQTGKIKADGTATNPIIFTTAAVDNNGDNNPDDLNNDGFLDEWPGFDPAALPSLVADATPTYYDDTPTTAPLAPLAANGKANVALWGGMVILGNAPTNLANDNPTPVGYGKQNVEGLLIPGFVPADVAYGGILPHDNSGSITYVSIRHAGDEISESNELNGLTMGGVGDGTTIQNVEIYCNYDDGFEWFGGTVNTKNLAVFFAGDDQFDLDQGYTGVNQYWFAVMNFFNASSDNGATFTATFGTGSGDKAGEFDGEDARYVKSSVVYRNINYRRNFDGTASDLTPWPLSNPVVYNVTILGSSPQSGTASQDYVMPTWASANRGIQMRHGFAGQLWNAIIVNTGTAAGLEVTDGDSSDITDSSTFTTSNNVAAGLVVIANTTVADGATLSTLTNSALANGNAITGTGSPNGNKTASAIELLKEDTTFNPRGDANGKLAAALKSGPINPRPPTGLGGIDAGASTVNTIDGIEKVSFRGAFSSSTSTNLFTTGWTTLNIAGLLAN